jgi:hypothetical protein
MRARQKIESVRDFERFLRRQGFTRAEARTIASVGWRAIQTTPAGEMQGGGDKS